MTAPTTSGVPRAVDTTSRGGPGESATTGNRSTGPAAVPDALAPDPAAVSALWEHERLLEERERIAADLHDHVIARLFAAALNLQRVVGTLGPGPLAAQLEVTDDGTGIDAAPARTGGPDDLARRAHNRHGTFSAEALH